MPPQQGQPTPPLPASAPSTSPSSSGKPRTSLMMGAGLVALAVLGAGIWFVVGTRGGDEPAAPVAQESPATATAAPSASEGTAEESPTVPAAPEPTGTGLQAVWRAADSTMLGLGEEYRDEPARINAILSTTDGLECEGRWQKDRSGDFLEMALLCKEDGVRVADKDRVGNLEQTGDTLSVEWKKGATGTETFERARDVDPA
ncbi:hypothetical protein [Streptomyces sp. NPDC056796]|uniref:hypothetical protein n=1 Tax=Streptomyces sp. NPDC056796 TaxID=3345947 RepID=UPI0036B81D9F